VKTEPAPSTRVQEWRPFDSLRNQVGRLFRDFKTGFFQSPLCRDIDNFWRRDLALPPREESLAASSRVEENQSRPMTSD
jgi:hypothetical protein